MGLISTNLDAVINNYSSPISYSDTESKGTNLPNIGTGQMGNPQGPPVPWWYPTNSTWSKHHMTISCSDFTYYIWQYQSYVRCSTTTPKNYWDGYALISQGGQFVINIGTNGSIQAQALPSNFSINTVDKAIKYYASNSSFINQAASALGEFSITTLGKTILEALTGGLTVNSPNYASQALQSSQLSYLQSNITGSSKELSNPPGENDFMAFSVGISVSASSFVGVSESMDLVYIPQTEQVILINTISDLLGVNVGVDTSIQIGMWLTTPSELVGLTIGATMTFTLDYGFSLSVLFDLDFNSVGFIVGISAGADLGFNGSFGWASEVVGN